jgi:hypothetical protein
VLGGKLQNCLPGEVLRPAGTEPEHD